MIGTPRIRSMKVTAITRRGKKAGPRSARIMAITNAITRISTSATMNILISSQNPGRTTGQASWKFDQLKNCFCTAGQVSEVSMSQATTPMKMTVEAAAISAPRAPSSFR